MFLDFRIAKFQLILAAGPQGLLLPEYKGSTLRGGFGHVFRRICCSQPAAECARCLLQQSCPYSQIFEPAPPQSSQVLKHYSDIPRPFVLEPPLERKSYYAPGDQLTFHLVLIGQAIQYLPYFILTFKELGKVGLGKGRRPFTLSEVKAPSLSSGEDISIYNNENNVIKPVKNDITLNELLAQECYESEQCHRFANC